MNLLWILKPNLSCQHINITNSYIHVNKHTWWTTYFKFTVFNYNYSLPPSAALLIVSQISPQAQKMSFQENLLHKHLEAWLLYQNPTETALTLKLDKQLNNQPKIPIHTKNKLSLQNPHYLCVFLPDDMHVSGLQPSGFQAQKHSVLAFHIQDLTLPLAFPSQEQHHSL